MDFSMNEETVMVRDTARRFFREKCPSSLVRVLRAGEDGHSKDLWKQMAELGWLGLGYDEAYGGYGGSFLDLFVLVEEMGKAALPSPFFSSAVLSGLLIQEAGDQTQKEALLPPMIRGEKIITLALLDGQGRLDFEDPSLLAQRGGGGSYEVDGTRLLVPYVNVADGVLLCANVPGKGIPCPTLFLADPKADGLECFPLDTLTREKAFSLRFDRAGVGADRIVGGLGQGDTHLASILPRATVLKCAEMLGGMERVLEMTVAHVKERHQFGKPLGVLQSVHHACAEMATWLETTRLVVTQAAWLLSQGLRCAKEIAMAKAWCNDAYKRCTATGHQLHGAIGFTEEHDMHLYSGQAKASEMALGASWLHRSRVADELGI